MEEWSRLYRVRKTVIEMLEARGYLVAPQVKEVTLDVFREDFRQADVDLPAREKLSLLVTKQDDPSEQLFVFFPSEPKVGVKPVRAFYDQMKDENVYRAVLVVQKGLTPFAKVALQEVAPKYIMEQFQENELLVNCTQHELVPKHELLSDADKRLLLGRYHLKEAQLPRMQVCPPHPSHHTQLSDPVARFYGLKRGQVVRITRTSETAGRYMTYRLVW